MYKYFFKQQKKVRHMRNVNVLGRYSTKLIKASLREQEQNLDL